MQTVIGMLAICRRIRIANSHRVVIMKLNSSITRICLGPVLLGGMFMLTACNGQESAEGASTPPPEESSASPAAVETSATTAPRVFFISPVDGATVSNPVRVVFGIEGMAVAPAGSDVPNSGHHHLLIDLDELPSMNLPIPKDDQHRHFGGGQTEAEIELTPGRHSLQLLLGDLNHIPHDPPLLSQKITITVE